MKLIVIAALALVGVALAAPPSEREPAQILRSDFEQKPDGGYSYAVETSDGTSHSETGEQKVVNDEENKPHEVVVVRGQYSYVDPEGKPHSVEYYADENGFHAVGSDIPKNE